MSQNYPDIPTTERLRDSRPKILDRDEAIRTCFSGDAFPTADLAIGQLCLRTDEGRLYQLKETNPVSWRLIGDLNGTALTRETALTLFAALDHVHDGRYAAAGHNHDSQYAGINHTHAGVYQPNDPDLTAIAALTTTGLVKRTSDGQATTVASTAAGEALLTAASAGAQRTALGLSDAATTSVDAIRAGVSGGVQKTGDTMTGELAGTTFKSNGTSATSTGFKLSNGTDIGTLFPAAGNAVTGGGGGVSGSAGVYDNVLLSVGLSKSGSNLVLSGSFNCNCNCNCGGG